MNPYIAKFYADKQLHVPKLIMKRPVDVTAEQVEAAAEKVYFEIQNGHKIKTLNIARHIWQVAKNINADAYLEEQELLQEYKDIVAGFNLRIASKNRQIKKLEKLCNKVLIYNSIIAVLAVGLAVWEVICIL